MNNNNNNGKVPIKIIQLLIDNVKLELSNSQEKIIDEIDELTKATVVIAKKINSLDELLGKVKTKVSKMILVVIVSFTILMGAVALAVLGAQLLYEHNTKIFMEKVVKGDKRITEKDLKDIILKAIEEMEKNKGGG